MQKKIIGKCMNIIKTTKSYSNEKLEEIEYGLIGLYMLITKSIIIFTIACFLGLFKELLIFLILYNLIRMPSFGLHATKSSYCLIASMILFFAGLFIVILFEFSIWVKIILGSYCIIRIYQNAPADTYKRPIINQKRREIYKIISTLIAILFVYISLFVNDSFLSNALICSLCIQTLMISPYIYRLFNLPYDNYKTYLLNNGLN